MLSSRLSHLLRARNVILAVALLAAAGAGLYFWSAQKTARAERYETQAVDVGDIIQTVSANGTLNPVVLVNVGTQVSGTIKRLYVDFNDKVRAGEVLAELDPALFSAQLAQSKANLESAEAKLKLAEVNAKRMRELFAKAYVKRADLDQAEQDLDSARAQAEAAHAQVERDRSNLGYTIIRSPVSGVVVARDVDVGQTVAASFQTPTLFKIAQDLRKMQIDTSVAEADIGYVRVGQHARFTVDAYPARGFEGLVKQIRLNPTIQQNVVTYDVVVSVDNPEELLMPGMTAYVNIVVNERRGVTRIPNAALRFRPGGPGPEEAPGAPVAERPRIAEAREVPRAIVYRLEQGGPVAVAVELGIGDNRYTEAKGNVLGPGDLLVVRDRQAKKEKTGGGFRFRFH